MELSDKNETNQERNPNGPDWRDGAEGAGRAPGCEAGYGESGREEGFGDSCRRNSR
jgi:hypothetical protein